MVVRFKSWFLGILFGHMPLTLRCDASPVELPSGGDIEDDHYVVDPLTNPQQITFVG